MKKYLLGIDVGTTGTKTMLFSEDGEVLGRAYRSYGMQTPQVGWSEQDPEDWLRAIRETVREICTEPEVRQNVAAISLSLQGGTFCPVDEDGKPVRPAIVWNDARCAAEREDFLREVGAAEYMYETTGWKLSKGLLAMEIRWMRKNEPENFKKTAKFLSVPDYVALRLTGNAALDLSDAGINQTTDIRKGAHDKRLTDFAGVDASQLGTVLRSGEVIGHLTAEAAEELGLTTDTVLVAGAHDQYAVALGAGAVNDGDILIGSGTSWVVTAIGNEPDFSRGLAQSVSAVPGKWGSLQSLSTGGVCLDWLRKNIALGQDGEMLPYDVIGAEAQSRRAAEDGLFFFPFSGKNGTEKSFSRGTFTGLDLSHDRFHMAKAVMEGVAFQIVWMMENFAQKPSQAGLLLCGGASRSEVWCRMVAEAAGLPVRIPAIPDLACVGAAIMAGAGCGVFSRVEEGCERFRVGERVLIPAPERVKTAQECLARYRKNANALGIMYQL